MSLYYLIDGYNMLHQLPIKLPVKLEDQRRVLIQFLESHQARGSRNNHMTVVFDGKSEIFGRMESASIKILFSKDETADEKIKRMVENMDHAKNVIVVTSDKAIQYAVRVSGARTMDVSSFLSQNCSKPHKRRLPRAGSDDESTKSIAQTIKTKITREMEKIWLNKK